MRLLSLMSTSIALTISACSTYPSGVDRTFGGSVRQIVQLQTANPDAPVHGKTQAHSDGQSAKSAVDRYQQSFDVIPLPTNVFNIGVGSGSAGTAR